MKTQVFLGAIFLMSSPVAVQALPAFYGAEGGGALSVGGRGGVVCQVTNLNNSGSGSLRACIDTHNNTTGSRMTVVFQVGGTINLTSRLNINNPYITIAGHTAPGGGIQLRGDSHCSDLIQIHGADHVIIRYLTLRKGRCSNPNKHGTIRMQGIGAGQMILDHLSLYWGYGAQVVWWGGSGGQPRNSTLQNSIIAEGLKGRSMGVNLGGTNADVKINMTDIDFHKNLYAHTGWRTPLFKIARGRIINNIVYNWWMFATTISGGAHVDIVNNLYKHPNPLPSGVNRKAEIGANQYSSPDRCGYPLIQRDPSMYIAGNQGPIYGTDNWNMAQLVQCEESEPLLGPVPAQWRRSSPLAPVGAPITVIPTNQLESTLYPIVGDSRRLDCMGSWVNKRDSQDARIVNHAQTNHNPNFVPGRTTWGIYDENEVGGFPTIAGGTPCQDTDGDGMPDEWEIARGLNPNDPSDRNTLHSSGYTMLEMYLNGPMTTNTTITTPANVRFVQ